MLSLWAQDEMVDAQINDARLNKRLVQILSDLGNRPTASIAAASGGHQEMVAAYRFFDNDKATPEALLHSHCQQTRRRMAAQEVVLLVQDTTEIDLTRPTQQVLHAGPLDTTARRGVFLHPLHALTPDGTPSGTAWCKMWTRDEESLNKSAAEKRRERKAAPIDDKESFRWLEGLQKGRDLAQTMPEVGIVCVADSEADIYEVFAEPRGEHAVDWLVRACQNRALEQAEQTERSHDHLREIVLKSPVLFTQEIKVRGRKTKTTCEKRGRRTARASRKTLVEVRAATITLRPPPRPDRELPPVTLQVVLVREPNPPQGEAAIEWLLVTTLPIETVDQVRQIVQYYCVRWKIGELLFRTLKSGCRLEERRFEHVDRLLACAAVYLIVAWRTLYLCRLGWSMPDLDCEVIFEPSEWKSVWMAIHKEEPPSKAPTLVVMIALIAQLGGYVNIANRKDPPGPQTVWLGLQRMQDFAQAWDVFGPGARSPLG